MLFSTTNNTIYSGDEAVVLYFRRVSTSVRRIKIKNRKYCSIKRFRDSGRATTVRSVVYSLFRFELSNFQQTSAASIISCCCCCVHIKSRSDLYSILSNIRTGPTDANAFRGHRLTTQKGYTYQKERKGPRKVNTHAIIGKIK